MLRNFKQHTNTFPSIQNIYTHSWMNCFWPFIVAYHYSMVPPGLDPEEGSQRFISFLVGLLDFRFRAVTFKSEGCVFLVQNVLMCVCVCECVCPTSLGSLFLFSFCFQLWLWFHLLSATCVELHPRFLCDLWRSNPEFGIGRRTPNISVFNSDSYSILKYV